MRHTSSKTSSYRASSLACRLRRSAPTRTRRHIFSPRPARRMLWTTSDKSSSRAGTHRRRAKRSGPRGLLRQSGRLLPRPPPRNPAAVRFAMPTRQRSSRQSNRPRAADRGNSRRHDWRSRRCRHELKRRRTLRPIRTPHIFYSGSRRSGRSRAASRHIRGCRSTSRRRRRLTKSPLTVGLRLRPRLYRRPQIVIVVVCLRRARACGARCIVGSLCPHVRESYRICC